MIGAQKTDSTTTRMKCPACSTEIRESQPLSPPEIVYRCPVCRLEFVADPDAHTLTLAPLSSSRPDTPEQRLPRAESANTVAAIEDGANPPNLIRERVPLELEGDRAAEQAQTRVWRKNGATTRRKRGTGT
jgi:hypothetical protein